MSDRAGLMRNSGAKSKWRLSLILAAAGLSILAAPAALNLRRSLAALRKAEATYEAKLGSLGQKGNLERRFREQEAVLSTLEDRLVSDAHLSAFTQAIAVHARAAGCRIDAIRPSEPRAATWHEPKTRAAASSGKQQEARTEFVETPVRVVLGGQYEQLCDFLARLPATKWDLQVVQATIQAGGDDPVNLTCNLEVAGVAVRALSKEK